MHTHIINGAVVLHSHPYNSETKHTHTQSTVELIQQLSCFITTDPSSYQAIKEAFQHITSLTYRPEVLLYVHISADHPSLRAPPSC